MTSTAPTAAMWFPVITTLIGAALGFFASFALAWFNHSKVETKELSKRQRERLEDLYKTLVLVRKDYQGLIGGAVNKIHSGIELPSFTHEGIPPIIKTEMLVKLYFSQLEGELAAFLQARDAYGKEWAVLVGTNTSSWPEQKRKEKVCQFLDLFEHVDNAIKSFQAAISRSIKP